MKRVIFWIKNHIPVCAGIALALVLLTGLLIVVISGGEAPDTQPTTAGTTAGTSGTAPQSSSQSTTAQTQTPTAAPSQTTQATEPTDTTGITQTTQPSTATEPTEATQPAKPTQPAQVTQPTQTVRPTETTRPTQPTQPVIPSDPELADFTIVTNSKNKALAYAMSAAIASKYKVTLPVTDVNAFAGGAAIYLGTDDFNSYGGCRYSICVDTEEVAIHVKGSGAGLETAAQELINVGLNSAEGIFPFDLRESLVAYRWDEGKTSLGMERASVTTEELAAGVTLHKMRYTCPGYADVNFFATVVKAGSSAKMMAVAAPWDGSNSPANPVKLYTVSEYAQQLTDEGYKVLSISNGGFFDLNTTKTNLPLGVQILDGKVKQAPSTQNRNSDNWVGMTKDGSYVISNTQGYGAYHGRIRYALGGGVLLMKDGVPSIPAGEPDYRTCAAVTKNGDLVILCADNANYAMLIHALMDLDLDVQTVLNMDGGGSTTLLTSDGAGGLQQQICGSGETQRRVVDTLAIVIP